MPKGGLARRATAIAQLRQQAQGPVLLLDSGNSLFALRTTATSDPSKGALPVEAMNVMEYDALALGERDLAADLEVVQRRFEEAAFPILSANVGPAGTLPNVQPYLLLRSPEGHVVAIVGVTSPAAAGRLQALGLALTVADAAGAVQQALDEIGAETDVVIVLSNLDQQENEALAKTVPGIDAIIGVSGGRQTQPTAIQGPEGQVVLHAAYVQGEYLGSLTLQFDTQGRVVTFTGQSLPLDSNYTNDAGMVQIMQEYGVQPK